MRSHRHRAAHNASTHSECFIGMADSVYRRSLGVPELAPNRDFAFVFSFIASSRSHLPRIDKYERCVNKRATAAVSACCDAFESDDRRCTKEIRPLAGRVNIDQTLTCGKMRVFTKSKSGTIAFLEGFLETPGSCSRRPQAASRCARHALR